MGVAPLVAVTVRRCILVSYYRIYCRTVGGGEDKESLFQS